MTNDQRGLQDAPIYSLAFVDLQFVATCDNIPEKQSYYGTDPFILWPLLDLTDLYHMHVKHNYIFYGSMAYIIHTGIEFGTLPIYMQAWDFYVNRLDGAKVGLTPEKSFMYHFASLAYWSGSRAIGRED